jgi:hypothetical protein
MRAQAADAVGTLSQSQPSIDTTAMVRLLACGSLPGWDDVFLELDPERGLKR